MVRIYTKTYCPFCHQATDLLDSLDVSYTEIDVTSDQDVLAEVSQVSGMNTVPQVFIGDTCIGGYDDLQKLHREGELPTLLEEKAA